MPSWLEEFMSFAVPFWNEQANNQFYGGKKLRFNHDQKTKERELRAEKSRKKSKAAKQARKRNR